MTTRMPFVTDSATFSAKSRQHVTSKKESFSSQFLDFMFQATPKLQTGAPPGVNRSSGSRVTLPTTVTVLSNAISSLRCSTGLGRLHLAQEAATCNLRIGQADDLVADHFTAIR